MSAFSGMNNMDRWGLFVSGSAIHRDWRSSHFTTSSSPFELGREEMKKKATRKKLVAASPPPPAHGMVVGGQVMSVAEVRDYQRRVQEDPRSVR